MGRILDHLFDCLLSFPEQMPISLLSREGVAESDLCRFLLPFIYFLTLMENFKHHTGRENSTVSPYVPSTQMEVSPTHVHPLSVPFIGLL